LGTSQFSTEHFGHSEHWTQIRHSGPWTHMTEKDAEELNDTRKHTITHTHTHTHTRTRTHGEEI